MKILMLDGTFGNRYNSLREELIKKMDGNEIEVIKLDEKKIAYCTGCWSCWTRTPGVCMHKDFTPELCRAVINADFVVHFTENSAGFATSVTKKALDKLITLVHPYIVIVNNECHHRKRYDEYPKFGLVFVDDESSEEDFMITKTIFERLSLNIKTELSLAIHVTAAEGGFEYEDFSI